MRSLSLSFFLSIHISIPIYCIHFSLSLSIYLFNLHISIYLAGEITDVSVSHVQPLPALPPPLLHQVLQCPTSTCSPSSFTSPGTVVSNLYLLSLLLYFTRYCSVQPLPTLPPPLLHQVLQWLRERERGCYR